ncbi:DUF805 domain-containing protein [Nocardioides hankookensis]|uniref:DUF805 domain-containing protein n=1 Tax=Nocardioides hankookensis TaxID=443157 RepID=A0ABW1LGN1_9ACTN
MSFGDSVRTCLQKYATFSGRASRSEFWWFVVFNAVVATAALVLDSALGLTWSDQVGPISLVVRLALLLPLLAVGARRLHDADLSGWWLLLALIPLLGVIGLLFMWIRHGSAGDNRFGPAPA